MIVRCVCSGIGAATVAWKPLGFTFASHAEIDPHASAVLAHHHGEIPNLGDFTKIETGEGPTDVLVGGTPCQDFSVAGLRAGLDGDRGNLTLEFLRLASRLRPVWVVWENVPGVLSIDGGRAFGAFLGGLVQLGYGWAYRVLDAQHFGVPQRRRRVFVVGHLGDRRRAAAVLFERQSLSGNPPPGREAGEGASIGVAGCLNSGDNDGGFRTEPREHLIAETLSAVYAKQSHNGMVKMANGLIPVSQQISFGVKRGFSSVTDGISPTLDGGGGGGFGGGLAIAFIERGRDGSRSLEWQEDVAYSQMARDGGGATDRFQVMTRSAVRRLTPRECERLQGFPDDYTLVNNKGKQISDSNRYKMIGNSMPIPVMNWIGNRLNIVSNIK